MTRALVNGAGGFIGGHLVKRLKAEDYWVRGVDLKPHAFTKLSAAPGVSQRRGLERTYERIARQVKSGGLSRAA
jgi:nucleoside-diphosphate-sugar epimerase